VTAIHTADMIWSRSLLVAAIPTRKELPREMLRSSAALWLTNILAFASWYWRPDAGDPRERELRGVHTDGALLFPQMTLDEQAKRQMSEDRWNPGFCGLAVSCFQRQHRVSSTDSPVL
jgi:hypothetical protein